MTRDVRHLRRWGAVYLLIALFVGSWLGQAIAMQPEIAEKGWTEFWSATFENWQSEFLQLFVQAVVVVGLADRLFAKSTEDIEHIDRKLDVITRRLGAEPDE